MCRRWFVVCSSLSFFLVASLALAASDGVYTGKTSQNRDISFTVLNGVIDEYSINWSCGGTSATVTTFTDCPIAADGTFSCGSSTCPGAAYTAGIEIDGTFAGTSVSGSYDLAFNTGGFAGTCCYLTDVTYSATSSGSPSQPMLSIADTSVSEGNKGTTPAQFAVTLSPAADSTVTVDWTTAEGTADSGDFAADSGTLTFTAGQTSKTVTISVNGDTEAEGNEVFYVDLTNATNAGISDTRGRCTITDDDSTDLGELQSIVPAASRGLGSTGLWVTSFAARNTGDAAAAVSLLWFERDKSNTDPQRYDTTIQAGATLVMDDVIMEAFGLDSGNGAIGIVSDQPLSATAVILNTAGGEEFGQGFPAIPVGAAVAAGDQTTVVAVKHTENHQSNVFIVDATGSGSTATMTLVGSNGAVGSSKQFNLGPYMPKLTSLNTFGKTTMENGAVVISTSAGAVIGGVSRVNLGTGDPVTLSPPITVSETSSGTCSSDGRYELTVYDDEGYPRGGGGYLEVVDGAVEYVLLSYSNRAQEDCNWNFTTSHVYSQPADLAEFASGVSHTVSYSIGDLVYTFRFDHDGNTGLVGTVEVFGQNFETDDEGCNGDFPDLELRGGTGQ